MKSILKRTNVLVGKEKDIRIFFMMLFLEQLPEGLAVAHDY